MNPIIFLITVTMLCVATFLIQIGVYLHKLRTTKEKSVFDVLPMVPYGFIGLWGLIVIIKNGVII